MKKRIFIFLLILLIAVGAWAIYHHIEVEKESDTLILYGNVDVRLVDIGFRVAGKVEKMLVEEGDPVEEGTLLGILDPQPYSDQFNQAKANLASIKASLANAESQFKRRQELVGDGSISQEELENIESSYRVYTANLQQAEASLAVAKNNLDYIHVYAPTKGIVLTRIKEPGTVINAGDPIYTVSISNPVWIRTFVPEPFLGIIFPGMEAKIYTDTPNGKVYTGKIGFISPIAEFTPKSVETTELRTDLVYRLRIYVDDPDLGLRQGMPITVHIDRNQPRPDSHEKKHES